MVYFALFCTEGWKRKGLVKRSASFDPSGPESATIFASSSFRCCSLSRMATFSPKIWDTNYTQKFQIHLQRKKDYAQQAYTFTLRQLQQYHYLRPELELCVTQKNKDHGLFVALDETFHKSVGVCIIIFFRHLLVDSERRCGECPPTVLGHDKSAGSPPCWDKTAQTTTQHCQTWVQGT